MRLVPAALASLGVFLASCTTHRSDVEVQPTTQSLDGAAPWTVDVENFSGSVRVIVDPRVPTAQIAAQAVVLQESDREFAQAALASVSVTAEPVYDAGRNVFTVRSATTWAEPDNVAADLQITVPRCEGVRVVNRGGPVTLDGVAGAVTVENAHQGARRAPVELRSAEPMTAPVSLSSTDGPVAYQVGGNSGGVFELVTDDGPARLRTPAARIRDAKMGDSQIRATVNEGANPVTLRTGRGLVMAMVIANPMTYRNEVREEVEYSRLRFLEAAQRAGSGRRVIDNR